jgi:hypothetical protein
MTPRKPARRPWLLITLLSGVITMPCHGQDSKNNDITAIVPSLGAVLAISPLVAGDREPGGDVNVSGTVTTRQNGPYRLQVRLTELFLDKETSAHPVLNQVLARLPSGSWQVLGTVTWVTIATGPGSASTVNPVAYLVQWGQGSTKNPQFAVSIPVEYRVVPP